MTHDIYICIIVIVVLVFVGYLFSTRHIHEWEIQKTHYTPPQSGRTYFKEIRGSESRALAERLRRSESEGVTHVYYRCRKCGVLTSEDFYGEYTLSNSDTEGVK